MQNSSERAAEALRAFESGLPAAPPVAVRPWCASGGLAGRALDLILSILLLVALAPVLLAAAAAVRLSSPGPVLYRQVRVGQRRSEFQILKFRTMYDRSDDSLHRSYVTDLLTSATPQHGGEPGVYKLNSDPRITPVGRFLRRSSLDELPQLFNVIRGDMALVGPRPALPWEVELFQPVDHQRFQVKPGVSGLAQVSGRNKLTMREALDLDAEYVRRRGLLLDLAILARTVPATLTSCKGR